MDTNRLEINELPQRVAQLVARHGSVVPLKELERVSIDHALRVTKGRVSRAAELLGMGRATLYRRVAARGNGVGE